MLEFNDHNAMVFCNEFSLTIEKDGRVSKVFQDPFNNKFTVSERKIKVVFKKIEPSEPTMIQDEETGLMVESVIAQSRVIPIDYGRLRHVLASMSEFANFWQKKVLDTTITCHTNAFDPNKDSMVIESVWA